MNNLHLPQLKLLAIYVLPALVLLFSVFLATSPLVIQYPNLIMGITYDLTLTAPIVYLIAIWKKDIPKITAVPIFIIGLLLANLLLPANVHLSLIETWFLPIIELTVISTVIYKMVQLRKAVRSSQVSDFLLSFQQSAKEVLGNERLAKVLATEASVFYYAFFTWKSKACKENEFTYHIKNGLFATLIGVMMVLLVETVGLHFFVAAWSEILAWVLTISSLYVVIQLFGHLKSLSRRPIVITNEAINLKYGLFSDAKIAIDNIESIEVFKGEDKEKGMKKMALLGDMEAHNLRIKLKKPEDVVGFYGITRSYHTLLFFVDEPIRFIAEIDKVRG